MALLRHTVFSLSSHSLSLSFLVIPHFSSRSLQFSTRILSILTRYLFSLDSFTFIRRFLIFSSVSSLSYRFLSFLFAFSSPTFPYASSFSLFFLFFFSFIHVLLIFAQYFLFFSLRTFSFSLSLLKSYLYLSRKWYYCLSLSALTFHLFFCYRGRSEPSFFGKTFSRVTPSPTRDPLIKMATSGGQPVRHKESLRVLTLTTTYTTHGAFKEALFLTFDVFSISLLFSFILFFDVPSSSTDRILFVLFYTMICE